MSDDMFHLTGNSLRPLTTSPSVAFLFSLTAFGACCDDRGITVFAQNLFRVKILLNLKSKKEWCCPAKYMPCGIPRSWGCTSGSTFVFFIIIFGVMSSSLCEGPNNRMVQLQRGMVYVTCGVISNASTNVAHRCVFLCPVENAWCSAWPLPKTETKSCPFLYSHHHLPTVHTTRTAP